MDRQQRGRRRPARAAGRPDEQVAWAILGGALLLWALVDSLSVVYYPTGEYPLAGPLDVLWLAWYPLTAAGLLLVVAARFPAPEPGRLLEGLQAVLLVAALGLLFVFKPALDRAGGSALGTAVSLAYPLLDIVLTATVLAVFALSGFRPGRFWSALGAGLTLEAAADATWAVTSPGAVAGDLLNASWAAAAALIAVAAWLPRQAGHRAAARRLANLAAAAGGGRTDDRLPVQRPFGFLPSVFPAARAFLIGAGGSCS